VWIAVTLPMLPLEAVRPLSLEGEVSLLQVSVASAVASSGSAKGTSGSAATTAGTKAAATAAPPTTRSPQPYALFAHTRVVLVDAQAQALGVRVGFARSHALALVPQLECLTPEPAREAEAFEAVALALCVFTPQIVFADAHTLLLDVTASLRLFGGLRALLRRIEATLGETGHCTVLGCAPTPWAAWLFARAGATWDKRRRRVIRPARLGAVLDALPATLLPAASLHGDGLAQIGCETLGAVRRLPRAGIARRFGAGLLSALAQTYGEAPDPRECFVPPPVFGAKIELMARVEHAEALLFAIRRLLLQLVGWLTARHAGVNQFTLTLVHETARHGEPRSSALTVSWSTPARELDHLLLMSREKLHRTELLAPVIELHLQADHVADYAAPTDTLFPLAAGPDGEREAMVRLLERLVARLGVEKVREVAARDDHRPEAGVSGAPYRIGKRVVSSAPSVRVKKRRLNGRLDGPGNLVPPLAPVGPRPIWLMLAPLKLATRGGLPHYRSTLQIVGGPERIEAGWWDGQGATRDYFIASGEDATLYWVYRERTPADEPRAAAWFLHGVFG
jgi:protein ImuB